MGDGEGIAMDNFLAVLRAVAVCHEDDKASWVTTGVQELRLSYADRKRRCRNVSSHRRCAVCTGYTLSVLDKLMLSC